MDSSWHIGKAIKNLREEAGIKQTELCRGVCSVPSLCRFERGERNLDYFTTLALLQRLGYGMTKYECYSGTEEWKQWEEMCNIMQLKAVDDICKLETALQTYQAHWQEAIGKNTLQRQFVLFIHGIIVNKKGDAESSINYFLQAIRCTVPNISASSDNKIILSIMELEIIVNLANAYATMDKIEKAFYIRQWIYEYLGGKKQYDNELLELYMKVSIQLAEYLFESSKYLAGLKLCQKSLKALADTNHINHWTEILYWHAKFQEQLMYIGEIPKDIVVATYKRLYFSARLFDFPQYWKEAEDYLKEE